MQFSQISRFSGFALAALALAVPAASRAQSGYTITDIGSLGYGLTLPKGINNSGQVVGTAYGSAAHDTHAFLYSNGIMTDLGVSGWLNSYAYGINDSGQIAGYAHITSTYAASAVRWTGTTAAVLTTPFNPTVYSYGINNSGQVTGVGGFSSTAYSHAVIWTGTTPADLGTLGGASSIGRGINDSGQVTGTSDIAGATANHAFRYSNGVMTDLGTLGGTKSQGDAINASGQVAGYSYLKGNTVFHAALWNGTAVTDIGTLYGGNSEALSVNASGDIVGYSTGSTTPVTAFLYTGGRLIDLNTLLPPNSGWQLDIALGINDNGWIAGQGHYNGLDAGFILKPAQSAAFGSLSLEGVSDFYAASNTAPLDTFHISFRQPGTVNEIYGADVAVTPLLGKSSAPFALSNIPPGQYDVAIKGAKSLRVVLPDITVGARVSLPAVHLLTGDANGDNSVDSSDFALMIDAYGGVAGVAGSNYDSSVDFNLDGKVDSSDFALMLGEFNNTGDL